MKNNILIVIFLAVLFGCESENDDFVFAESERTLCLEAPSKEMISPDVASLKKVAADVISIKNGVDSDFKIQNISYLPADKGYVAVVEYKLQNGLVSNFIIVKGANVKFKSSVSALMSRSLSNTVKSRGEGGDGDKVTVFSCLADGKCSQDQCKLLGEYNPEDKVHTLTCACNDCIMKVTTR